MIAILLLACGPSPLSDDCSWPPPDDGWRFGPLVDDASGWEGHDVRLERGVTPDGSDAWLYYGDGDQWAEAHITGHRCSWEADGALGNGVLVGSIETDGHVLIIDAERFEAGERR